ncbi:hypothetical protein C7T94_01540 [Pedobacter yulinensis]|uniref:TonB C-terminal domain-containing protein n=1 Tax=Pedobacter yulinensis TaxID=2126353 RepID=A0A2T3HQV1_9SPHI|nr:TonB family protein [Pedobacter yulinensis]PST84835.1 hypothetical protein C7T94_01540 [Pedobacter yulinensis]
MNWAHYMLQVNLYLVVFYTFYRLLLHKETWFKLNRLYLLGAGAFSIGLPFMRIEWLSSQPVSRRLYAGVDDLNAMVMQVSGPARAETDWGAVIAVLYATGVIVGIVFFVARLFRVKHLFREPAGQGAFSFFNRKVVGVQLPERDTIQLHEDVHIRQFHSADIIFFEAIRIFTWFNPVSYLLIAAVKATHEYLADEAAANYRGDKYAYSMLLLSRAFGLEQSNLISPFFAGSMVKKRIFMLTRERSRRAAILKYGLMLPVLVLLMILSSASIRKNDDIRQLTSDIVLSEPVQAVQQLAGSLTAPAASALISLDGDAAAAPELADEPVPVIAVPETESTHTRPARLQLSERENTPAEPESATGDQEHALFPGGMPAFYKFLAANLRYPAQAVRANASGRVHLAFTVGRDGRLGNIRVLDGIGYGCDEEAIRVVGSSQPWQPALQHGSPVAVTYNINLSFKLDQVAPDASEEPARAAPVPAGISGLVASVPASERKPPVIVRGVATSGKAENAPLVIVDGKPLDGSWSEFSGSVQPERIAAINVLKSQSATTLYGQRAANGVIIVTTKDQQNKPADKNIVR